jgi:hypothetical protein
MGRKSDCVLTKQKSTLTYLKDLNISQVIRNPCKNTIQGGNSTIIQGFFNWVAKKPNIVAADVDMSA